MNALFSNEGLVCLDEMVRPGLLCAFDFDGTLAPLVPVPEDAHLPDEIRDHLLTLSQYAPVAIITGRSVSDISRRLGFQPEFIVGNHGLEGVPGWEMQSRKHEELCSGWREQLNGLLQQYVDDPGLQVEDKRFSLSIHYRLTQNPENIARRLKEAFKELAPQPRVVDGKFVFNLLAEDACNKGSALGQLMQMCEARNAIYVGDDVTDEDVFRMRRKDVLSVRIEHSAQSAADFFLPAPGDIVMLLEDLTARLRRLDAHNWMQKKNTGRASSP